MGKGMLTMGKAHSLLVMFWIPEGRLNIDFPQILGQEQVALIIKQANRLYNRALLLPVWSYSAGLSHSLWGNGAGRRPARCECLPSFQIVTNDLQSEVFTCLCVCLCFSGQSVHLGMGGSWSRALPCHLWTLCHILPGLLYILLHWRVSRKTPGIPR